MKENDIHHLATKGANVEGHHKGIVIEDGRIPGSGADIARILGIGMTESTAEMTIREAEETDAIRHPETKSRKKRKKTSTHIFRRKTRFK